MIFTTPHPTASEFERVTGWALKPEGACKDERCIPLPDGAREHPDLEQLSQALRMPLVSDEERRLWALGPESGGKALTTARAPELRLPDVRDGREFSLQSLRGKKVLLLAWASW